jgi:chromate transport protein ChrA
VSVLSPGLWDIGLFFLKVGAFSYGGGLAILLMRLVGRSVSMSSTTTSC